MQFVEEAKKRRDELQRELKAIEKFLAFYEEEAVEPLPGTMTLSQARARKIISVRLGNCLFDIAKTEGSTPEKFTLTQLQKHIGFPITDEMTANLLKAPNFGRKALNELRLILERVNA